MSRRAANPSTSHRGVRIQRRAGVASLRDPLTNKRISFPQRSGGITAARAYIDERLTMARKKNGSAGKAGTSLRLKDAKRADVKWKNIGKGTYTATKNKVTVVVKAEKKDDRAGYAIIRKKGGKAVQRWRQKLADAKALGEVWLGRLTSTGKVRKEKLSAAMKKKIKAERKKTHAAAVKRGKKGAAAAKRAKNPSRKRKSSRKTSKKRVWRGR